MEVKGIGKEVVFTRGVENFLSPYEIAFMGLRKGKEVFIGGAVGNKEYEYSFYFLIPRGDKILFVHEWYGYHGPRSAERLIEKKYIKHVVKHLIKKVQNEFFEWGIEIDPFGNERDDFYELVKSCIETVKIEPSIKDFSKVTITADIPTSMLTDSLPKLQKEMLLRYGIVRDSVSGEYVTIAPCWKEYEYVTSYGEFLIHSLSDLEGIFKSLAKKGHLFFDLVHRGGGTLRGWFLDSYARERLSNERG